MVAQKLLGTPIAQHIYARLQEDTERLGEYGKQVSICGVLVGNDPASTAYLRIKEAMCKTVGINFELSQFPEHITENQLIRFVHSKNSDPGTTGIIVQLPLPYTIERDKILLAVAPEKDIDAFFYTLDREVPDLGIRPPTPAGMLTLFDQTGLSLQNKTVVVIGHGLLVGKPLVKMLRARGVTAKVVVQETKQYHEIIASADVLFTGVGQFRLVRPEMVKSGVIIIDAGYTKIDDVVYGDVAEECALKARFITPPIGGVGPLTVAILLQNAVELAKQQLRMES